MSAKSFTIQPQSTPLYQDEEITISAARIEIETLSCASKFISSISVEEKAPSRHHGWAGIAACVVASLTLLLYLYLGKISAGVYILAHLSVVGIALLLTWFLLLTPQRYRIEFSLINGQTFEIKGTDKLRIQAILDAIKESVARSRQDPLTGEPVQQTARGSSISVEPV